MRIFGVDFTSAPCRRKAITVAAGRLKGMTLAIQGIERLETFSAFEALLARPGPLIGGFDFPFGLPAEPCRCSCSSIGPDVVASCWFGLYRYELRTSANFFRTSLPSGR